MYNFNYYCKLVGEYMHADILSVGIEIFTTLSVLNKEN